MKISSLSVHRWRNLADVHIDVPADASMVCLVGENGTGKSNLLELIAGVAGSVGLTPGVQMKRGQFQAEPHEISLTLRLPDTFQLSNVPLDDAGQELMKAWDHTLTYASANPAPGEVIASVGVVAGGIADPGQARGFGNLVVGALQAQPEVTHLYLDAERSFPPIALQDQEIWSLMRQDLKLPTWVRQQAAVLTQTMYSEWLKWMLAQALRAHREYYEAGQSAARAGDAPAYPVDQLEGLRRGICEVLPHLQLSRLDTDQRTLYFDTAGRELRYENLSGGEQEIVFLVGQIERFQLRNGLFLLDEPELHLNPDLLRTWLSYLSDSVDTGQVWIATHALEAVEVAGLEASIVFERDEDRIVRSVGPLGDRPVLTTLAGAVGTPALSLARSRFVLVEGERPGRERERFAKVLDSAVSDRFVEVGGCTEVLRKLEFLRQLASETDHLRVGAIIDRDLRTDEQVAALERETGVHVLPVHEIENVFLEPETIRSLGKQIGLAALDPHTLVQAHSDRHAGRWILQHAATVSDWGIGYTVLRKKARAMTWDIISSDIEGQMRALSDLDKSGSDTDRSRRRVALVASAGTYAELRANAGELWLRCFGKEVLVGVARDLGALSAEALEARAVTLWATGAVRRPTVVDKTRLYVEGIPVLS